MGTSYVDLLKDPRWQRRRLEVLNRDLFTCRECGDTKTTLHVHHRRYIRGRLPWQYEDEDLLTLCEVCHSDITTAKRRLDDLTARLSIVELGAVAGFVLGILAGRGDEPPPDGPFERWGFFVERQVDWNVVKEACARAWDKAKELVSA